MLILQNIGSDYITDERGNGNGGLPTKIGGSTFKKKNKLVG